MRVKELILVAAITVSVLNAQMSAPMGTVMGKIIDESTGEALIGANVFITGTTTGTITDFDGNYTLANINPGIIKKG